MSNDILQYNYTMRKTIFAIFFSILLLVNVFSLAKISKVSAQNSSATGFVSIKVLEENSLVPILNATVCIVETRGYYQTDKYGYTQKIAVPVIPNPNFDISLKRDWGEFTIIVYKNGYSTFVSYYNTVLAGTTNVGIVCTLCPIINSSDPTIISAVQNPPTDYTTALVNLYKK